MATLTIKNVSKIYSGGVKGVSQANVEVADGEFLILVGPSGCGKSTLLRMIAGLEDISAGEISINGRLVNDVPAKDRDIAMVFQNYALYPHMTVYENMGFGLKMRKFPKAEIDRRVREAAETLDLSRYLDRKPKQLSGGQQQRVAVGRAIVRQPKLFLFDEPLSNLDAKLRVAMRAELIKLHKRLAATIVYVTHDQVEAMSMGSRLVVLKDGKIQQIGAPLEVYRSPANLFVAGFVGSPPMNFLECIIESRYGQLRFVGQGFELDASQAQATALSAHASSRRSVTLGVRPEDIRQTHSPADENYIRSSVIFPEPLGGETFVTCLVGGREVVARLDAHSDVQRDEPILLVFDMQRTKVFDPATGDVLA